MRWLVDARARRRGSQFAKATGSLLGGGFPRTMEPASNNSPPAATAPPPPPPPPATPDDLEAKKQRLRLLLLETLVLQYHLDNLNKGSGGG